MNKLLNLPRITSGKTFLTMKFTIIFLLAGICNAFAAGYAQSEKVTIKVNNATFKEVISAIEKQTDYVFFYKTDDIANNQQFNLDIKDKAVNEILDLLTKKSSLSYYLSNKYIFFDTRKVKGTEFLLQNQGKTVTGRIVDVKGEPIIGATVVVKNNPSQGTITDIDGNFTLLNLSDQAVLLITYVGMKPQEVSTIGRTTVDIVMEADIELLDEVVVVGYGTQKRKEVSGAISSVKINELSANVSNNLTSALQGRVAGVSLESNGGAPGAGLSVTIRGSSTLGNNSPLVVIDGIPFGSLDGLNPSDIQSIDILKDASSANIYGSRAAGGVIMVTTKVGRRNSDPKISFNATYSHNRIPKRIDVLSGEEMVKHFNANGGSMPTYNNINTNWQDHLFRSAPSYKANMDISGGSEHFVYSISGSYVKQEGTIIHTHNDNANFRIRSVYEKGRIKVGETFIYNYGNGRSLPGGSGDQTGSPVVNVLVMPPTIPLYDDTNPLGGWGRRPVALKNLANTIGYLTSKNNQKRVNDIIIDAFLEFGIIDKLKYKLNLGYSTSNEYTNLYESIRDDGNIIVNKPRLTQGGSVSNQWLVENILSYEKTIDKHNFSLMAGYSAQKDTLNSFGVDGVLPAEGLFSMGAVTSFNKPSGYVYSITRTSTFGRATYAYDNRYSVNASVRQDRSSIFDPKYNSGIFYGASTAWNISDETFYENSAIAKGMNYLKLRVGIGALGNDRIGPYTTQSVIASYLNLLTKSGLVMGSIPAGSQSPRDLSWEKSSTINVGLDAAFFDHRLSMVFDWFKKKSTGVLLAVPIPISTGIKGTPIVNAGNTQNYGMELSLNYADQVGNWKYNIGWNMASIKNKMVAVTIGSGKQEFGDIQKGIVGYPLGSFFLIKNEGTFKTQQEVDAYVSSKGEKIQPTAKPGDLKFVDYNGDGIIDDNDQQYLGSPIPSFETGLTAGLGWKNFDMNLLIQGVFGNKIYNKTRYWSEKMNEYTNLAASTLNAWSQENPNSNFPRFELTDPNQNARLNSDRWLENGSYVRFKRIEIGYSLPNQIVKEKLSMDKIRAYIAAENLFTITKYSGFNPDIGNGGNPLARGNDYGIYPIPRTISLGISLSF